MERNLRLGGSCNIYMGTFDYLTSNVLWESFGALVSKWPVAPKRLAVEQICYMLVVVTCLWRTFDLLLLKVIRCTCLRMACNLRMASRTAKRSEIWDSEVVVTCNTYTGTFDLLVFVVILGSFGALVPVDGL